MKSVYISHPVRTRSFLPNSRHRPGREATRFVVVFHYSVYPGEEDGCDAGCEAEEVVA